MFSHFVCSSSSAYRPRPLLNRVPLLTACAASLIALFLACWPNNSQADTASAGTSIADNLIVDKSSSDKSTAVNHTDSGVPFNHQKVIDVARELAQSPYQPPEEVVERLAELDNATYQQIQFNQREAIWGNSPTPFSIQLFAPGYLFKYPVDIDIVESGKAFSVNLNDDSFLTPNPAIRQALTSLGKYAGFRLHYPLTQSSSRDEFVVFQGASYFRALSKGQRYGLSARGLAIDVAEPKGEEQPLFRRFWIERPGKQQTAIVVHALLDSESITGAYRFGIYPNDPTRMEVKVTLFPRKDLPHVGLAPLTSMYMHGPMSAPKVADYRPAVHNSEALAITRGNGEHLWRPLNNPRTLQISAFADEQPKGFGLIQRQRYFAAYEDLEAQFQQRPSAWVEPIGEWGKGVVQLVEIPSSVERNDNIVAYWRPDGGLQKDTPYSYSYRLTWPNDINHMPTDVRVVRSAGGVKLLEDHRELVIDFSAVPKADLDKLSVDASISQGRVLNTRVVANPTTRGARVFVAFDAEGADHAEVRVQLRKDDQPFSETWLYRWLKPALFVGA